MSKAMTINGMLESYKGQIAAALPKHITPDRMARLAMTAIRKNAQLGQSDPVSLFGAIIQAAQLGLEPGINAHLVPFRNRKRNCIEVQMIPDYRGLVALARRSGEITRFKAEVVCENDLFEYEDGSNAYLRHRPAFKDRGAIIGAYAIAKFKNSEDTEFVFMTKEDIDAIRGRSRASGEGPWVTDYAAMAKKTVAKQLAKWLPVSVELSQAVQLDDLAEAGLGQGNRSVIGGDYVQLNDNAEDEDPEAEPPRSRIDAVRAALENKSAPKGQELASVILKAINEARTERELLETESLVNELPQEKQLEVKARLSEKLADLASN